VLSGFKRYNLLCRQHTQALTRVIAGENTVGRSTSCQICIPVKVKRFCVGVCYCNEFL